MGKSLYNFSKENNKKIENLKEKYKEELKKDKLNNDDVKKKINNYSKLSEGDLMKELYKEVAKQKAGGEFNPSKLASQFENLKPMLNQKQSANLEKILKNLK